MIKKNAYENRRRPSVRVLTVNMHNGFSFLNRRFISPELRSAVRAVRADLVFLQEVQGDYAGHAGRMTDWPPTPQYEFRDISLDRPERRGLLHCTLAVPGFVMCTRCAYI